MQQQSRLHCDLGSSRVIVLSQEEQISRAEILLRLIKRDQSFSSCDDLVSVLHASFNDPVATGMTLGTTKASYSISYGLGSYYHEQLINDTGMKNSWYSLIVDETTTEQNVKQFDMHVRYWSASENKIARRYLSSSFLGHARATI